MYTDVEETERMGGGEEEEYTVLVKSCGKKFLRESIFADWRVFVFCGN